LNSPTYFIDAEIFFFYDESFGIIGVDEKLPYGTARGVVSINELKGDAELYGLLNLCIKFLVDVCCI